MGPRTQPPLVAPFAITSLDQQERVLRSPTACSMLWSLGRLGLQGIAAALAALAAAHEFVHCRRGLRN